MKDQQAFDSHIEKLHPRKAILCPRTSCYTLLANTMQNSIHYMLEPIVSFLPQIFEFFSLNDQSEVIKSKDNLIFFGCLLERINY